MSKTNKKATLADKISNILTTTPLSLDPEEDIAEETAAKVTERDPQDSEDDETLLSTFRKQNIDLLEDVDIKYAGKNSSRKDLRLDSDSDDTSDNNEVISSSSDDKDNDSVNTGKSVSDSEGDDVESQTEEEDDEGSDAEEIGSDDHSITNIQDSNFSSQITKGLCVRNQLNIWESLLEIRIQLQKCLTTANKMPRKEIFTEIKVESGERFTDKVAETKNNISNMLDKLLELQILLLKQYPESKSLSKSSTNVNGNEGRDEEIASDTEEEKSEGELEENQSDDQPEIPKKKRKLADYDKEITDNYNSYKEYRNSVIQKWNDKTRIGVAKSNNLVHSVLNQIEHQLSDKDKLRKRTQTKRSEYNIVGQKETSGGDGNDNLQEFNTEIFDDDDFYHQLLRELIEVKSADITDPVQLGRQWIQLQNLRSKMKRKIDTKATKGRKVRYTVHSKLVNFMAPIDQSSYTDEAKTELFNSLFGKNQHVHVT